MLNVTINDNSSFSRAIRWPPYLGGGVYNSHSNPIMVNVTVSNNISEHGGGICNRHSNPYLSNVTISLNNSNEGGGILNEDSNPVIKNSIFWGNEATETGNEYINAGTSSPEVSWSIFKGGYPDGKNILTDDPFLQPLANNGGFTKTHAIPPNSPAYAIPENAGDGNWNDSPDTDQRGMSRNTSGHRAMGAYEDQKRGSLQINITPQQAAEAGAQWRIKGKTIWHDSGETVHNIPTETYIIEFLTVPGWRPIENIEVEVQEDYVSEYTGIYKEFDVALSGVMMLLLEDEE